VTVGPAGTGAAGVDDPPPPPPHESRAMLMQISETEEYFLFILNKYNVCKKTLYYMCNKNN
jgi:hypothetical protein